MARFMDVEVLVVRGKKGRRSRFKMSGRTDRSKGDSVEGTWDLHRLLADESVDEVRLKVVR